MPAVLPAREWVPSCFLVAHSPVVSTSIRYTPMQLQRTDAAYFSTIRIYGRSPVQPVWSSESGPLRLHDVHSIDSAQIAQAIGAEEFLSYGEAYNWTPDMPPPTANTGMPIHAHYTSRDGSMLGRIASFVIFGAPRSVVRGESYYENFPGARVDAAHRLSVFTINPFVRPSRWSVRLVYGDGREWESESITVRGKGVARWNSDGAGCPESAAPIGVIVKSDLKQSSFFATRDGDGRMIGLDHGHPFLAQVLDHRG